MGDYWGFPRKLTGGKNFAFRSAVFQNRPPSHQKSFANRGQLPAPRPAVHSTGSPTICFFFFALLHSPALKNCDLFNPRFLTGGRKTGPRFPLTASVCFQTARFPFLKKQTVPGPVYGLRGCPTQKTGWSRRACIFESWPGNRSFL